MENLGEGMSQAYRPFDPYAFLRQRRAEPSANPANLANPAPIFTIHSPPLAELAGLAEADRALPKEWRDALARIESRARPVGISAERWTQAVADAVYLVREWGAALARCGWMLSDLFSAHPIKPLARYDAMGICLLLQGRKIGPIDADRIAIRQPGEAVLHFQARTCPEAVMLWDLA
jgi:hypothetical protein